MIERPVEEVFDFVADERNEPRYNSHMIRAEQLSAGCIGAGTQFRAEIKTMGRVLVMTVEFTIFERPARLGSRTRMSGMDTEGYLTFEPVGEATRMRWSWEVRPRGAMKIFAPLLLPVGRRQEKAVWTSLKHCLEMRG